MNTATVVILCGKCGHHMATLRDISPKLDFPVRVHVAPCEGCDVERHFLEQISKPVEEREGYSILTNPPEP